MLLQQRTGVAGRGSRVAGRERMLSFNDVKQFIGLSDIRERQRRLESDLGDPARS